MGLDGRPAGGRSLRWYTGAAFVVLGALVVITFFVYISRLSSAPSDGYAAGEQPPARTETSAPANVTVTVDKGAAISWEDMEDVNVIGYNVYRYKAGDDPGSLVNLTIISDTVYHDDEGTMFNSYAVAAVDTSGREGVLSNQVAAVPEPVSLTQLAPTRKPEKVEDTAFSEPPEQQLSPGLVHCTAEGMTYYGVWYKEHYAEVTGGALMVTPYGGDSVSYTFSGDSVAVISTRHWNYGIMRVYIDGELRQEVDLYSPQISTRQAVFSASGLGSGAHTIKLVCAGRKNQDANFTFVNLEALQIK